MKIVKAEAKKIYFDNYGQRRFFSADLQIGGGHQSLPAFAFPNVDGEEDKIKKIFKDMFQFENFNEEDVGFPIHVIENGAFLWGLVSPLGKIFSLESIYCDDAHLNRDIKKFLPKFNEDYPGFVEHLPREDMVNSIVALYLLKNNDEPMVAKTQHYYSMLLLRNDLSNNMENQHSDKPKMKI